ncbi:MAG TPA: DUF2283 domain-containing protein [Gemmataceae bacterium]|nr:DUF2283 domain-containing protein [Gemmataceae bacterium]
MGKPLFRTTVSVDEQTGRVQAVYFYVREGQAVETREIIEGRAMADYDAGGHLLGVELLAPCAVRVLDSIAEQEPEPVKKFLRGAVPMEMVAAA